MYPLSDNGPYPRLREVVVLRMISSLCLGSRVQSLGIPILVSVVIVTMVKLTAKLILTRLNLGTTMMVMVMVMMRMKKMVRMMRMMRMRTRMVRATDDSDRDLIGHNKGEMEQCDD